MQVVSVVCPVYNEEKFIDKCILSVVEQDYPKEKIEFFLIDGRSTDNTRKKIIDYAEKYSFIHLIDNPHKTVPYALNAGIKAAKGEIIIRLDGHCIYPVNYISVLVEHLEKLKADNVGALWNTLPAKNNSLCMAIAIGASHKFGIGNSLHKIGVDRVTQTDTVPFGCFPREIFDRIGLFDTDLVRNQDDEFNARIIKNGGKIYLIPELVINYYARDKVSKMAKMFYQYGLFKPLVNKKLGAPATIRQFFPVLFLIGIVGGAVLSIFSKIIAFIYWAVLLLYLFLSFEFAWAESVKEKNWRLVFLLPFIFFVIHVSYGWGYLKGIFKVITKRGFSVNINR